MDRSVTVALLASAGASPHLPAGILSPYSDGERGALVDDFANRQRCEAGASAAFDTCRRQHRTRV
ncbi:hypothetical protein CK215_13880 [Mesorhizobium sp. WSM3864]|nr:hypothetical protein CK215_13880 [Mesorhizobium sp. WSM3864]